MTRGPHSHPFEQLVLIVQGHALLHVGDDVIAKITFIWSNIKRRTAVHHHRDRHVRIGEAVTIGRHAADRHPVFSLRHFHH
jgi:hypothetical protein